MSGASITTSRIPTALLACDDRLRGIQWSKNVDTGERPSVFFMDEWDEETIEAIHLVGKVNDAVMAHLASGPAQRTEEFDLLVRIFAASPDGARGATIRARTLLDQLQIAFRDQSTGQHIPLDLGGNESKLGGIYRIEFDVAALGDQGHGAVVDVYIKVHAHI